MCRDRTQPGFSDVSTWLGFEGHVAVVIVDLLTICFEGDCVTCWFCFCEERHYSNRVLRSAEKSFKEIYPPIVHASHCNKWGTDFKVCS